MVLEIWSVHFHFTLASLYTHKHGKCKRHISETTRQYLTEFSLRILLLAMGRSSVDGARITLCISGFVDDVMSSHNGLYGAGDISRM